MIPQTEVPNDQVQKGAAETSIAPAPVIGFKSSEFVTVLGSIVAIGSGHIPANYVPLVSALAGLYVAARTVLKAVHVLGYAKQVPDLPEIPTEK